MTPDGSLLLAGRADGTITVHEPGKEGPPLSFKAHARGVYCLELNHDATILASAGGDAVIRLWEPTSGKLMRELSGFPDWDHVATLAFSPDGQTLASGHTRGIILWDVRTGSWLQCLRAYPEDGADNLAFSRDGGLLAAADGQVVRIWGMHTREVVKTIDCDPGYVSSLAFHPGGDILAVGDSWGDMKLLEWRTGKSLACICWRFGHVPLMSFDSAGDRISCSDGWSIRTWDLRDRVEVGSAISCPQGVLEVRLDTEGQEMLAASRDERLLRFPLPKNR